MKCDLCEEETSEMIGIRCAKYKICDPCVRKIIDDAMMEKVVSDV